MKLEKRGKYASELNILISKKKLSLLFDEDSSLAFLWIFKN
jgi:hypothetical protein